jgi:poly-gamma-glutamate synthesis protein (capsule biosynthesis protein)
MTIKLTLTGDINLMNVEDATIPFKLMQDELKKSDLVFSNLECCLFQPEHSHSVDNEGFYANPKVAAEALKNGNISAVSLANNVNYGHEAILNSIKELDEHGFAHTGAGINKTEATRPVILERKGIKIGFLARTSVYWNTHHEARKDSSGVAVLRGHTAYQVPAYKVKAEIPPFNRPGIPPVIVTWADREYLKELTLQIKELKTSCDFVVVSCHWGLWGDVLEYMTEIAHAAIDAGADIIFGHGPHLSLPVEMYHNKPIFYGLGSFSFHTGHNGRKHGDWVGEMPQILLNKKEIEEISFKLIRHNDQNETYCCDLNNESETIKNLVSISAENNCCLLVKDNSIFVQMDK